LLRDLAVAFLILFATLALYLTYIKTPFVFLLNVLSIIELLFKLTEKVVRIKPKLVGLSEKRKCIRKICKKIGWLHEVCTLKIGVKSKGFHHATYIEIKRPKGIIVSIEESMASQLSYDKEGPSLYIPKIYGNIDSIAIIKIFTERRVEFKAEISIFTRSDELIQKGIILSRNLSIEHYLKDTYSLHVIIDLNKRKISVVKSP